MEKVDGGSQAGDPLISKHEEAEIDAQRAPRAANLFDLRRMIGGCSCHGAILVILGLGAATPRSTRPRLEPQPVGRRRRC